MAGKCSRFRVYFMNLHQIWADVTVKFSTLLTVKYKQVAFIWQSRTQAFGAGVKRRYFQFSVIFENGVSRLNDGG